MNDQIKDSFVVVSDFHGADWVMDKIRSHYINEYEKIFNLGDIIDRGEQPFKLLLDYMELSKQNPDRVIYVPGNHDSFIYGAYMSADEEQRSNYRTSLIQNGGLETYKQAEYLRKTNPSKFNELIDWLGSQPLQRVHTYEKKKYALAHAFFNQTIYNKNPNYSLKDYMRDVHYPKGLKQKEANILWFRKNHPTHGYYNPADLPSNDYTMIIGHTANANDLGLFNVDVICVDGAANERSQQTGSYSTRKFDGGSGHMITVFGEHLDTSNDDKTKSQERQHLSINYVLNNFIKDVNTKLNSETYAQNLLYKYAFGIAGENHITGSYRELISKSIGVSGICSYLGLDINCVNEQRSIYSEAINMLNNRNIQEAKDLISSTNNEVLIGEINKQILKMETPQSSSGQRRR